MRIQLEQVVAEQSIYAAGLLPVSVARQPLDQLLPVRLSNAWLRAAEAELERSQQRSVSLKFYDPNKGYVSVDGTDIRKYRLKSLRHQYGLEYGDEE